MLWMLIVGCGADEAAAPEADANVAAVALEEASMGPLGVAGEGANTGAEGTNGEPTCPDGIIVADGWSGEYPGPVVNVTRAMTVRARNHPCDPAPTRSCQIAAGLIHPWVEGADAEFVTVRAVEPFRVEKALTLGNVSLKAGDRVALTQVIGEGFCRYQIDGTDVEAECPGLNKGALTPMATRSPQPLQMARVACGGPGDAHAWLLVDAQLMGRDGIEEGKVLDYGKVGAK